MWVDVVIWLVGLYFFSLGAARVMRWLAERIAEHERRVARERQAELALVRRKIMSLGLSIMPRMTTVVHIPNKNGLPIHLCEVCAAVFAPLSIKASITPCHCQPIRWCQASNHACRLLYWAKYSNAPHWHRPPWEHSEVR